MVTASRKLTPSGSWEEEAADEEEAEAAAEVEEENTAGRLPRLPRFALVKV